VVDGPVRIDIWSDVICPWCYLGSHRLSAALDRLGTDDVEVRWHAFELDPRAPAEPGDLRTALDRKYGPGAFEAMAPRLVALGRPEGIDYRFDRALRVNTFDAHRLLAWADGRPGGQGPLAERLFRAYFTDGADVSDHATLVELVAEVGGDAGGAASVLAGSDFADEVRADEAVARERGITGVPAFVVDDRMLIPGAQDVDTMVNLLRRAAAKAG
jgi:predicted DsbA family dithiol-disulfide isomerase